MTVQIFNFLKQVSKTIIRNIVSNGTEIIARIGFAKICNT